MVLERDWAVARAHGFKSSFAFAVQPTGVPEAQIEAFLRAVRETTAPLRQYEELRKRVMKLESYYRYEGSLPLWNSREKFSYEQSKNIIMAATQSLGLEYSHKLDDLFRPGWVDLYPCDGKRAGAYAAGVYGTGAFLFLNSHNDLRSVFSLAHEAGHSVHAIMAYENQPFCVSEPPVFLAEIASTLNEQQVYACLSGRFTDGEVHRMLLDHRARSIVATFYTQAIWADFEIRAHHLIERGLPVTADSLNHLYASILRDYYGDVFTPDESGNTEWASIPHLFTAPFYVYQYVTSFAVSLDLNQRMLAEGGNLQTTDKAYLALLKSGGNGRPADLLKQSGFTLRPDLANTVANEMRTVVTALELSRRK